MDNNFNKTENYNDHQNDRRRESILSSCHSENLSDIVIQEGARFKHIQHHLDEQNSDFSIQTIEKSNKLNDIRDKIFQQIETEFSPDKVFNEKRLHLLISQDENTPHFNQSKLKGSYNTNINAFQQISPLHQQKLSLIQESIFKFKPIQQTQNSEYNPNSSIEQSHNNSNNQQKQEIDSYTLSLKQSKQLQQKMAYGGSQQSLKKYQQSKIQNLRNSLVYSDQISPKVNTNKSIIDSCIIHSNIQSIDTINPVFSTKLRQFVKQKEKSNFSSYREDFDHMFESDSQNGNKFTQNKENDINVMNIYSLRHIKQSQSQVKNIIQDLILNVSMDLQEQDKNYKNKRSSLYNVEIPSKILKILNQDKDRKQSQRSFKSIYQDISPKNQINIDDFEKVYKNNIFQSQIKSLDTNSPSASSQNLEQIQRKSKSPSNKNVNQFAFKKQQKLFHKRSLNVPIQIQKIQLNQLQNSNLSYGTSPSNKLTTLSNQIKSFQSLQQYYS